MWQKNACQYEMTMVWLYRLNPQSLSGKHSFSGSLATGETLIGASIVLTDVKPKSTFTNAYGFYSINAIEGTYKMSVSFIGYVTDTITIVIDKSQQLLIGLQSKQVQLATVIVSSKKKNENIGCNY